MYKASFITENLKTHADISYGGIAICQFDFSAIGYTRVYITGDADTSDVCNHAIAAGDSVNDI